LHGDFLINDDNQAVLAHVANNMKRLRAEQNISQQTLADVSGVSRRMVAAIENGNSNISLAKLGQIATVLGVSFATIVSPHGSVDGPRGNLLTWRGAISGSEARLSCSLTATGYVELWWWKIAAADSYQAQPDPEGWYEMIHVVEGTLTLKFDDRAELINAGESTVYHSSQCYAYYNETNTMLKFIRNVVR
jgi:DNA-binding XRE family transcriptional regulator